MCSGTHLELRLSSYHSTSDRGTKPFGQNRKPSQIRVPSKEPVINTELITNYLWNIDIAGNKNPALLIMTFTFWCKNRNHWLMLASSDNCNDGLFSARWKYYFLAKCCFLRWFSFFVCQHHTTDCPALAGDNLSFSLSVISSHESGTIFFFSQSLNSSNIVNNKN